MTYLASTTKLTLYKFKAEFSTTDFYETFQLYNSFDQLTVNLINIPSILIQSINLFVITMSQIIF